MKYADVILPLPLENSYTYSIPSDLEQAVIPGCRVIVHFGKKRYYTAIVMDVHECGIDSQYETKEIYALLDATPVLRRPQLRFWKWIASYYLCKLGDVYKAALPSGLKLESETAVTYNEDFEADGSLRPNEQAVLDAFTGVLKLTVSELEKKTGLRNVVPVVASLMAKGAVEVSEELKRGFMPKMQTFIRLAEVYKDEEKLQAVFADFKRAKKQEHLLICFLELSHALNPALVRELSKKELLENCGCSPAILDGVLKRGVLESYEKEVGRLQVPVCRLQPLNPLSEAQRKAYGEIHDIFREKEVCLLHGVTSSGKTEVYVWLIDEVLKMGRQVLYMLPEIAITTQITERLAKLFGDKLLVYHSKFSDNERVEVWNRLLHTGEPMLVLGVRSSLFLPFKDLGLIIIDEEHENTYKQQDPAPRYHARNAAIVLASMYGAKTLLGTATPSVETWHNATSGKYGLVELKERYKEIQLPEIIPVDIKELHRKKMMKGPFSPLLLQYIREALEQKEQVILFQNRRGFAPMIECNTCGWVPKCKNCDVSLTYHKGLNQLTCHYCGYTYQLPRICPACEGTDLRNRGFGTEKIEDDIKALFPDARVARMDLDTTRTRTAYERIISDFQQGKTDILIGTQMVSKGLDFDHVSIVGILNADTMLNYPDFRAYERAFQLMAQVAGRAGRKNKRGRVVLQTKSIDHPIIPQVIANDYEAMVGGQLAERQMFHYPPYYRLVYVYLKNRNETLLDLMAQTMAAKLRTVFGNRVLGPDKPPVARVQTLFIRKIVLKIETNAPMARARELLVQVQKEMVAEDRFKSLIVYYDVDPM